MQYVSPVFGHLDCQFLVRELIHAGALFVEEPDWSSAELVEYYRDQGNVQGDYKRIVCGDRLNVMKCYKLKPLAGFSSTLRHPGGMPPVTPC